MGERNNQPSLFIGSSSEGLKVAEYLQGALEGHCEATIWSQGVFGLSQGTLESLVEACQQFDFAALILTPDDLVTKLDKREQLASDNVLFELGLFMGSLGRERTFIVYCEDDQLHLPSSLAAIKAAKFKRQENMLAAINSAALEIRNAIKKIRSKRGSREDIQAVLEELGHHYKIVSELKQIHHMLHGFIDLLDLLVACFVEKKYSAPKSIELVKRHWNPISRKLDFVNQFFIPSLTKSFFIGTDNFNLIVELKKLIKKQSDFQNILKECDIKALDELSSEINSSCISLLCKVDELVEPHYPVNGLKPACEDALVAAWTESDQATDAYEGDLAVV